MASYSFHCVYNQSLRKYNLQYNDYNELVKYLLSKTISYVGSGFLSYTCILSKFCSMTKNVLKIGKKLHFWSKPSLKANKSYLKIVGNRFSLHKMCNYSKIVLLAALRSENLTEGYKTGHNSIII